MRFTLKWPACISVSTASFSSSVKITLLCGWSSFPVECERLEESVLSKEKKLTVRGASPEDPTTCLPARVREIVTKNLNESSPGAMSSVMFVHEENRVLQVELGRLEDLLAQSRADRDELAIKYNTISERLEHALRLETGDGDQDSPESPSLAQQNVDLRKCLDEEQAAYKRKLTAYQEGQQRQAQLVQKLQAKVLQYKKRCGDLEQTLVEKSSELELHRLSGRCDMSSNSHHREEVDPCGDLENALIRLEEEQQRSSSLSAVNAMLREQLEQAGLANEALSQDIRRLTVDWSKSREELEQRESDWRREEESFHSYFSSEHSRLLSLWRQVVGFRRQVCELKSATERDLSDMRNELARTSHSIQSSCSGLSSTMRNREGGAALALEREVALRGQLELQLRERVAEMMSLQTRTDAERAKLNARRSDAVQEGERLKGQTEERDRDMAFLTRRLEEQIGNDETDMQVMRAHTETLLDTLRDIAQTVLSDGDSSSEADQENTGAPLLALLHGSSPHRSSSPQQSTSPSRYSSLAPVPEASLSALRSAVNSRHLQLQEVRGCLSSAQSSLQMLRRQLAEADLELDRLAREAAHYKAQERASVGTLTIELLELRSQLEEAGSVHDRELYRLQENCTDLQTHTDIALKELEECRASLSASEES
ncbi:hypothetical protein J4Q44_G00084020 [Coregonus suidteri]|uniref:Rootletin-like coiled-coil domain-containing protein n=1 Tax=Coregonus suidteri TaxID=861788 RepID=A0AAN8R1Z0_9TELE